MQIIGLTGRKGSGKNAVASIIAEECEKRGLTVKCIGFADNLKWAAARLFWPEIDLDEAVRVMDVLKNDASAFIETSDGILMEISVRQLLQHAGTEMGRELFGENFWVDLALPTAVSGALPGFDVLAIYDMRFDNEAARVKEAGGVVWEVTRPLPKPADEHVSEAPISRDLVDREIANTSSLFYLRIAVQSALHGFLSLTPA